MGILSDKIERLLFGATAAERVDLLIEVATRRAEARLVAAMERLAAENADDAASANSDDMPTQACAGGCGQSLDPMDMEECGECFRLVCVSCFPAHEATCGKDEVRTHHVE